MSKSAFAKFTARVSCASLIALAASHGSLADDCESIDGFSYLCGPNSAEDLVLVPGADWLIASGFGGGASMYLIDAEEKTWSVLYPHAPLSVQHDDETYGACPGPVDSSAFVAHGLNIRAQENGRSTLYVVGHGAREAIEVFDVDASGAKPALTWVGCVLTPDGLAANSVASLADGSLIATIPLHEGFSIETIFDGVATGALYSWAPGQATFTKIVGTEMGYANGVEVSADGSEFYVASSADWQVIAFTNTNPARRLRETPRLSFIPDNLHMGANGKLLTAGLEVRDPNCGTVGSDDFDLASFASCNRGFTVLEVDPETMETEVRAFSAAQEYFSNVTMAIEVNEELWIGTFAGDRIAYTSEK